MFRAGPLPCRHPHSLRLTALHIHGIFYFPYKDNLIGDLHPLPYIFLYNYTVQLEFLPPCLLFRCIVTGEGAERAILLP